MTSSPPPPRRLALALLAGALYAAALAVFFPPGRYDVLPILVSGTAPIDETYWSAPLRDRMGEGRLEPYDQGLALSLALPQNAIGAAAAAVGAPYDVARNVGSWLAAFVLAALAVLWGGWRGIALGVLLLNPMVWGHLASDLGEGPALAIVAGWLFAACRGRWALAGALAGLGIFQKGCGLFLGVGCLGAVVAAGDDRLRRLTRCGIGALAGIAASALLAWGLFGDDPLAFLVRPWTATADVRPVPGASASNWLGHLLQAAFAGYHGAGPMLWILLLTSVAVAPRSRPTLPALVALLAGLGMYALFPDPQRLVPLVPLLVLPAFPARGEAFEGRPTRAGGCLAVLLLPQAAGSTVGFFASGAHAWVLLVATLVLAVGMAAADWRRRPTPRLALLLAVGAAFLLLYAAALDSRVRSRDLHRLADEVAARVPPDAALISSPVLGLRHRGTLWYRDFEFVWSNDLARARPARVFRLRGVDPSKPPRPEAPPWGFVPAGAPVLLGAFPYSWNSHSVDVYLDEFRPGP